VTIKNSSCRSGKWWRNEMPCSVRLNDCCRREKTFPTMTYFKFDGAPGEHPGHPRGSHPPLAQPPLGMFV